MKESNPAYNAACAFTKITIFMSELHGVEHGISHHVNTCLRKSSPFSILVGINNSAMSVKSSDAFAGGQATFVSV